MNIALFVFNVFSIILKDLVERLAFSFTIAFGISAPITAAITGIIHEGPAMGIAKGVASAALIVLGMELQNYIYRGIANLTVRIAYLNPIKRFYANVFHGNI